MAKRKDPWRLKWVSCYTDRHGRVRFRYRRTGFAPYTFRSEPGSEGFAQEYRACLDGVTAPQVASGGERAAPGTFDDLIGRYYLSSDFLDPSDRTRVVYRGVLERWRKKYGKARVRHLTAAHVEQMMAEMLPHRTAANMLRKRLAALMKFAVRQGAADVNPVLAIRPYKVKTKGFHTWTDAEVAQYQAHHPLGTRARLALDLMLWTGQRPGDVRLLGPQHRRCDRIVLTQEKTGAALSLPIMPALAESIMATPSGALVFLPNELGRPFTRKGFGNKVRQWCDEAGLPHCAAHGLRKAAARRLAEAGCSNQQIKAWTGHATDSEVSRYTKAADQVTLSDAGGERLLANLRTGLAKNENKPRKRKEKF